MALYGTLGEFSIDGVLRLLDWSGSVGLLTLESRGHHAAVWVRSGVCLWACTDLDRASLDGPEALVDAVFEISLLRGGEFRFEPCLEGELQPPQTAPSRIRDVLKEVAARRTTWLAAMAELPSLDQVVELAPGEPPGDVVVRPAEWRLLTRIDRGCTLRHLLRSGDGLWRTGEVVASLIANGLVRVSEREDEPAPVRIVQSLLVDEVALLAEPAPAPPAPAAGVAAAVEDEPPFEIAGVDETDEADEADELRRLAVEALRDLAEDEAGAAGQKGRFMRLISGER